MANLVRTAKGRLIDLNQLMKDNQKTTALGNGHMNARGDIIQHGKVVKTVEEQRKEYEEANERTNITKNVPVSSSEKLDKILESEVEELQVQPKKTTKSKVREITREEPKSEPVVEPETDKNIEGLSLSDILNN